MFGSCNNLVQGFCFGRTFQFCLAFSVVNPKNGIVGITVDGLDEKSLIPAEGQSVDDGQELSYIVSAFYGAVVEYAVTCLQVYTLVFHRAGISGTACIHSPSICLYLKG